MSSPRTAGTFGLRRSPHPPLPGITGTASAASALSSGAAATDANQSGTASDPPAASDPPGRLRKKRPQPATKTATKPKVPKRCLAVKAAKKAAPAFVPSVPFESSSHGSRRQKGTPWTPLVQGDEVAYFMDLQPEQGGADWYVGTVVRVSKPHWADIDFIDGKLWCAVKLSEQGARWVSLAAQ